MEEFIELGNKFEPILKGLSNFKFEKTGQSIEEQYIREHSGTYKHYEEIGCSSDKGTINDFEQYLVRRFKDLPNCDNDQVGGNEMTNSSSYSIYVVYNQ